MKEIVLGIVTKLDEGEVRALVLSALLVHDVTVEVSVDDVMEVRG